MWSLNFDRKFWNSFLMTDKLMHRNFLVGVTIFLHFLQWILTWNLLTKPGKWPGKNLEFQYENIMGKPVDKEWARKKYISSVMYLIICISHMLAPGVLCWQNLIFRKRWPHLVIITHWSQYSQICWSLKNTLQLSDNDVWTYPTQCAHENVFYHNFSQIATFLPKM